MKPGEMIVTIDGPAGAGKSTVARALAAKLGWVYLDTGAMYRAVAVAAIQAKIGLDEEARLSEMLARMNLIIKPASDVNRIFLHDWDITDEIRRPKISSSSSAYSALAVVREAMVPLQRSIGRTGRIVTEGRDQGTMVFPRAIAKFFLDAQPVERARRRFIELRETGEDVNLEDIGRDMDKRDRADSSRNLSPTLPAEDAVVIDSTGLDVQGVVDKMFDIVMERIT
ncbi:MAG: (d)CMP kinase [Deltaproteobacteria bacterium]|nr:(d)CMP kinase [Deltaproteobacteria bacterium]